jgi:hypothetical protein
VGSVCGPIRFLLPVCRFCWCLCTFNIHLYMHIFRCIFLSNYWWQESDIWSQASYRYPISWEAFFDPSNSYFPMAEERRYHKWALAHSSSCFICFCSWLVTMCDIWPVVGVSSIMNATFRTGPYSPSWDFVSNSSFNGAPVAQDLVF